MVRRLLILVLCTLLVGCAQTPQTDATITLNVAQSTVGETQVDVHLADAGGQPLSGAVVQLRGDMTHAGMQPVLATMDDLGNGQYRTDDWEFTMAGDWILTVQAEMPDGTRVEQMFDVRGVKE